MNKSPEIKKSVSADEMNIVIGYQNAARSSQFMETLKGIYRSSRKKAQEGLEKNNETSAYWSGRADAVEILIDNCTDSLKVNLAQYDAK